MLPENECGCVLRKDKSCPFCGNRITGETPRFYNNAMDTVIDWWYVRVTKFGVDLPHLVRYFRTENECIVHIMAMKKMQMNSVSFFYGTDGIPAKEIKS
jgi:hypothetical protein